LVIFVTTGNGEGKSIGQKAIHISFEKTAIETMCEQKKKKKHLFFAKSTKQNE